MSALELPERAPRATTLEVVAHLVLAGVEDVNGVAGSLSRRDVVEHGLHVLDVAIRDVPKPTDADRENDACAECRRNTAEDDRRRARPREDDAFRETEDEARDEEELGPAEDRVLVEPPGDHHEDERRDHHRYDLRRARRYRPDAQRPEHEGD